MTAARSRRVWVGGGLLLAAALTAHPLPPAESALAVSVSPWGFPSRPLALTLEQRGLLAGRHLAVYVFVDQNLVERVTTSADRTQARLSPTNLAPGRHLLMAKAGREVAQAEFRVLSWSWLAGGGGLLLAATAIGFGSLWRHRRRPRQQPRT